MTQPEDAPDRRTDVPEDAHYEPAKTSRRNAAKLLIGASGIAAIGSFAIDMVTGLSSAGVGGGEKKGFVKGARLVDEEGNPLTAADALPKGEGKMMDVFPEKEGGGALKSKQTKALLFRFSEDQFKKPTKTDKTVKGYVAYSQVCTHAGCLVDGGDTATLSCPCHGSKFNVLEGAKVTGGPAPRPLPQLPLGVGKESEELLLATGPFEESVGAE